MSKSALAHDAIKPLCWLLGKWRSLNGQGYFPTITDFKYIEELEFFHVGQPNIQFRYEINKYIIASSIKWTLDPHFTIVMVDLFYFTVNYSIL